MFMSNKFNRETCVNLKLLTRNHTIFQFFNGNMFDEKIMDISKFVRNFKRVIPCETIFRYDVFPLTDRIGTMYPSWGISRKNSDHCLTPRESVSCNWQLKQMALTAYPLRDT